MKNWDRELTEKEVRTFDKALSAGAMGMGATILMTACSGVMAVALMPHFLVAFAMGASFGWWHAGEQHKAADESRQAAGIKAEFNAASGADTVKSENAVKPASRARPRTP